MEGAQGGSVGDREAVNPIVSCLSAQAGALGDTPAAGGELGHPLTSWLLLLGLRRGLLTHVCMDTGSVCGWDASGNGWGPSIPSAKPVFSTVEHGLALERISPGATCELWWGTGNGGAGVGGQ